MADWERFEGMAVAGVENHFCSGGASACLPRRRSRYQVQRFSQRQQRLASRINGRCVRLDQQKLSGFLANKATDALTASGKQQAA